jgi:Rieske Fe-S protein
MQKHFDNLENWTRERFPMVEGIEYRWSGQVQETFDGLAFIGRNPLDRPNVYVATGDSGMGMTHGMIAGILLTDLIQGRENPWESLYDPTRKTTGSLTEFVKENVNVATEYADWVMPGEVKSVDEIPPGSGAVIREGLKKIAVYRDEAGTLHRRSAMCTHLGCVVGWNDVETTWDCPCHGSRFDKFGEPILGPANTPLSKAE